MASISDWWSLGVLLEDTVDSCEKDVIVYVMVNSANMVKVYSFVEHSYSAIDDLKSDLELMNAVLEQGEEADLVVVIPKNRKITFLPKKSVRIMEEDEWKERLLSLIDNSEISEKDREWETLRSLFKFIYLAQSTYIESTLNQLKQFQAVPSEMFSQTTDILKPVFEMTFELMEMRYRTALATNTALENPTQEMVLTSMLMFDMKKAFSENFLHQLQTLFLQIKAELEENECLYIDPDPLLKYQSLLFAHPELMSILQQLVRQSTTREAQVYVTAFIRFIHLEPILLEELKNTEFNTQFLTKFHNIARSKDLENVLWDDAMASPAIETYLNRYYLHKNGTMPCYYYKEKTMCSLACRAFGKVPEPTNDEKLIVLAPLPEYCPTGNSVGISARARAVLDLRDLESNTPSDDDCSVFFPNNTTHNVCFNFVKTWRETDEALKDHLVHLMETETVKLHYYLVRLLHNDEHKIGVFMKCILDQKNSPVLKHTGVCWYALLYCLQHIASTVKVFKQKKQNIVEAFKYSMKTTMTYATMRAYLRYLEPYFGAIDCKNMEREIKSREAAEQCFNDFFNGITNHAYTEQFNRCSTSHGYVFFTCFCSRFMRLLLSGNNDGALENDLKVLHKAIHKTETLQQLFNNTDFKKQLRNLLIKTGKPIPSNVHHHLDQLFSLSWPQFHSRVMTENAILNEAELESVEKIRSLGVGVSAEVYLSRVPDIPSEIVAKIFEPAFYKDLGNELRLQMRLQSHPQVAHIYGYIVEKGKYVGLLMEHCKGGSMQDALNEQDLVIDEAIALNWLRQAASGLMFLHENNCVHRDVKPGNMLLNKRRTKLKISDLGVTKEERVNRPGVREQILQIAMKPNSTPGVYKPSAEPGITDGLSGDCGTPGYQAPEIVEGEEKATPAVDVFSLGRTIWQLVYNRRPTDKFVDDTWGANQGTTTDIYQHEFQPSDELKNLALRRTELWHKDFISRMMSPLKEDRPKMREIYQQLTEMHAEHKNSLRNDF